MDASSSLFIGLCHQNDTARACNALLIAASDRLQAFEHAQEWGDKIPIGLLYRNQRPTLEEQIPAIANKPLVAQQTDPQSFSEMAQSFR